MKKEPLLTFPCEFPLKVIVRRHDQAKTAVLNIIEQHVTDAKKCALKTNKSSGDKYVSYTITITAESQKQLDAIYQALNDCEFVVMTL